MMTNILKVNIHQFDASNVLLQNAVSGEIPSEQATLVLKEFMKNSAVTQLAKYEPMTKPKKKFTYLAEGPGAYWVSETERIQTSKATWLTAEMETKKLAVILPVSKEFYRYTVPAFFNEIRPAIAEAFYIAFDQAALFGVNSPFKAGTSVFDRITTAGNTVQIESLGSLYDELNGVIGLIEDGDGDPNGFTTIKKFRQKLRGVKDTTGNPIFNDARQGVTSQVLGLPIGYADAKSWDQTKAHVLAGDWKYARYGILQNIEYKISEDATLTTITDVQGNPFNLFERDMFALRATMHVGFMTLKDEAFAALTPKVETGV